MTLKTSSIFIKHSIEKWGQEETTTLIEFFENMENSIEKINSYKFAPENEPGISSD